jgi:anti-sigma B factor antagonist
MLVASVGPQQFSRSNGMAEELRNYGARQLEERMTVANKIIGDSAQLLQGRVRTPGSSHRGYRLKRAADSSTRNIEIEVESGEDTVVRLKGRIDVDSSPDVRDHLRAILLKDPVPHSVSVDLAGVTSIEASGIATLVESLKVARDRGIRFHLQGHGSVLQLFESAGLLALFDKKSAVKGVS